jgi:hypothetical protein
MLHYSVRKFFSQVLISSTIQTNNYQVSVINDYNNDLQAIRVELLVYTYQSISITSYLKQDLTLPALKSIKPFDIPMKDLLCPKNIGMLFWSSFTVLATLLLTIR